ncbi:MAG: prepilin-type N-terminal cleavage/methylation domain-containing protein, partial [Candidatus Mcinerneyibacterium aminivorans]
MNKKGFTLIELMIVIA